MRRYKRAIFLNLITILMLLATASFAIAWTIKILRTEEIILTSGTIRLNATLFQGQDENLDGILDLDQDFNPMYVEIDDLFFSLLIPGQIYTFMIRIENVGGTEGHLSVLLSDIITSQSDLLTHIEIEFVNPNTLALEQINVTIGDVLLFETHVLSPFEPYEFIFKLHINQSLTQHLSGQSFEIQAIKIRLQQIINP